MVVWITGMSGSGKSTLANELIVELRSIGYANTVLLDGDAVRDLFGNDLGYKELDRVRQIQRMHNLSLFLEKQNLIVFVAALFSREDLLAQNRNNFMEYFEIYLEASVDFLITREFKGIYKKALSGELLDVVGVDIPWHPPKNPDVIFNLSEYLTPQQMTLQLIPLLLSNIGDNVDGR